MQQTINDLLPPREKAKYEVGFHLDQYSIPYFQIILVSSILLSIISAYIFVSYGLHNAHFDSKAHLLVARRIFDNLRPGWIQIGAFWLPLPHVLYVPMVQNDFLYYSGIAAIPFSMASFVGASLLLYKLIEKILDPFAAFCGSLLYITNPNLLYLQTTALTENLGLLFMIGAIYFFVRWSQSKHRKYLLAASAVSALGVLTRYENWFVAATIGLLLVFIHAKERLGWKNLILNGASYASLNLLAMGIALWINWYTTGSIYHDHSHKHTDFQPGKGSLILSSLVVLYTIGKLISFEWMFLAVIAFYFLFRRRFRDSSFIASLALLAPLILYLYEYYDNHPTRIRYGLPFLPACVFFLSYWPTKSRLHAYLFVLFTAYIMLFSTFYKSGSSELLEESMRDVDNLALQDDLIWYLRHNDDGTLILASMGEIAPVLYDLKLPVKRYIHEGAKPWWNDARAHPEKVAGWVFLSQDDQLWQKFHDDPTFHKHFALIGRRRFLELYRRSPDEKFNLQSHKPHATEDKSVVLRIPGL